MQLLQGRNIIPRKNKQWAYGIELQNLLNEKKSKILKRKGMKNNGI